MPYLWQLLQQQVGAGEETPWLRNSVRYGTAFVVLSGLYAIAYAWLPDTRQRVGTVLPGAVVGAALWAAVPPPCSRTRCTTRASWRWSTAASRAWSPRWCSCT
ncbi:MAG: hypothetical protein QM777_24640 [Pseudorhodoferax sp.]